MVRASVSEMSELASTTLCTQIRPFASKRELESVLLIKFVRPWVRLNINDVRDHVDTLNHLDFHIDFT